MIVIKNFGLCLLSSLLLVLAFPYRDMGNLAWVAIVPLFLIIVDLPPGKSVLYCFTWCIFIFLGTFNWLLNVYGYRWYHHAILAIYISTYIGSFGLGFSFVSRRLGPVAAFWAAPFLWIVLEYIRGNFFFLALPWGLIGHTQYQHPAVIQIASLLGTYSISFLILLVNATLANTIFIGLTHSKRSISNTQCGFFKKENVALLSLTAFFLAGSLLYGFIAMSKPITGKILSIALVQGNIEQVKKWDPEYADEILKTYVKMTFQASRTRPDLIVWPETATPGPLTLDPEIFKKIKYIVRKTETPLVLGSAWHQKFMESDTQKTRSINSAFLVVPDAETIELQQYGKIKLFPFGEYLPKKEIIPWELINVSSLSEYVPGKEHVVFRLPPHRFGVTICWENIFPALVRQFVKNGAQFVINITNEARFGKSAAPYQLAAMSVFRAVENKIYIARCSNTGVSCIIDPHGKIVKRLQDENGQDLFVQGILHGTIIPTDSKTFYTRNGDLVPILAIVVSLVFIFIAWSKPLVKRKIARDGKGQ